MSYKNKFTQIISVAALFVFTVAAFGFGTLWATYSQDEVRAASFSEQTAVTTTNLQLEDSQTILATYEQALTNLYQKAVPSVVYINVFKAATETDSEGTFEFDSPFPNPFGQDERPEGMPRQNLGQGSGFVWDDQGYIVTNHHVVAGATQIEVEFADGQTVEAEIIGSDPNSDLAVIKIDPSVTALSPLSLGDSEVLQVGQLTIAIGNPFGQEFTMTSGIVSAVGRTIRGGNGFYSIPQAIQTDAAINPGNSGGPLLNRNGHVIGINTQIISRSGGSSGIGFAVPINIAKEVIPALIAGETYEYAWLGISGVAINEEVADLMDLPTGTEGAIILEAAEDGPADQAGLHGSDKTLENNGQTFRFGGDVITAIDGQPVDDMDDLISYLVNETRPEQRIVLSIIREDGEEMEVEVTLGVRPTVGASSGSDKTDDE